MRRFMLITAIIFLGLSLAPFGGTILDVLAGIAFGWARYSARVLPRATIAWDEVATAVVCLVAFTFGLHRTLEWSRAGVHHADVAAERTYRKWSIRWTISIVTLIVVMFVVGIAATGIVHQAGWLVASRRSLVQEKLPLRDAWGGSVDHMRQFGMVASGSMDRFEADESRRGRKAVQSWMTEILPDLGITVGGEFREDLPWNDPRNSAYFKGIVPYYRNPEIRDVRDPDGYALSHYAGNIHVLGRDRSPARFGSGNAANTILAGEIAEGFKPWGDPANLRDPGPGLNTVSGGFGGPSGLGANLLFLDGSVRFFRDTTSPAVLRRLSLPEEGLR